MPVELQAQQFGSAATSGKQLPNWLQNLQIVWAQRVLLARISAVAFILSIAISVCIPNIYVSEARIMPPENSASNSPLLAALTGNAFGTNALAGLAASLMESHHSGALFIDLLRSSSVTGRLIDQFQLQKVYGKRYRIDAVKTLQRRTSIAQDKKSGVLTISVRDTDPARARDLVLAYLDQLDIVVNRTSTSSAHQERIFIEKRLQEVKENLARAQQALSEFSSTHSAIDLREQARATVESEARLQGELIAAQAELESVQQTYGASNVRVRAGEARVGTLKRELARMGGSSAELTPSDGSSGGEPAADAPSYLPLRQLPRLAVPYADLYREVHVQETVYELLTQQYEAARIQEVKDIPAVNVIDAPGIAEKKSFPPRTLITLALTLAAVFASGFLLILRDRWQRMTDDPRKHFAEEFFASFTALRARLGVRRATI